MNLWLLFGMAIGAFITMLAMEFSVATGTNYHCNQIYREAGERGLGRYVLNSETGKVEFEWSAACAPTPRVVPSEEYK